MIADALHEYAGATARVWVQDRTQTVGASEVGRCARQTYYSKNEGDAGFGSDRDADHVDGWGARKRGSIYEDAFWAPAVKARWGDQALYVGEDQRTFVDGFLSGTPDGLLIEQPRDALARLGVADIGGDSILLDAKTIDPRVRLDGPKPEHAYQVIVGMGLVRSLTNFQPAYAVLSYTDASFWDEVREFPVAFDPLVFAQAKARARDIMVATSAQQLKPEGVIAGGKECEHCPFTAACGQARAAMVPEGKAEVSLPYAETIAELARRARADKEAADALTKRAKETEYEIRAMLAEAGSKRLDYDGISVVWSPVKGRPSYDMKAIREAAEAAGIDISQFERTGDPTDRLAITARS